jgi:hypothetical protein
VCDANFGVVFGWQVVFISRAGIAVVQMLFGVLFVLQKPEIWETCCIIKWLMFGTGLEVLLDPDWLVGYRITSAV